VLRDLIAGKRTSINGKAFQIDRVRIGTTPPAGRIPIYLAAISPSSWEAAREVADGIATIWNEETAALRERVMAAQLPVAEKALPAAALIPFSLSREDFFEGWNRTRSLDELKVCVGKMTDAGLDEVIIAYREIADIETAAGLIEY